MVDNRVSLIANPSLLMSRIEGNVKRDRPRFVQLMLRWP